MTDFSIFKNITNKELIDSFFEDKPKPIPRPIPSEIQEIHEENNREISLDDNIKPGFTLEDVMLTMYTLSEEYVHGSGTASISFVDKLVLNTDSYMTGNGETKFFYVNGILNDEEKSQETANKLKDIMEVDFVLHHNPTEGGVTDVKQAIVDYFDKGAIEKLKNMTPESLKKGKSDISDLREKIIDKYDLDNYLENGEFSDIDIITALDFIDTLVAGDNLKLVAHSHGAAVIGNALVIAKHILSDKELFGDLAEENAKAALSRVQAIIIGPAATEGDFPSEVSLGKVANPKDPVPQIIGTPEDNGGIYELNGAEFSEKLDELNKKRTKNSLKGIANITYNSIKDQIKSNTMEMTAFGAISASTFGLLGIIPTVAYAVWKDSENLGEAHDIDNNYLEQERIQRVLKEFAKADIHKIDKTYQKKYETTKEAFKAAEEEYSRRFE